MKCGLGLHILNRPADSGLHTKRHRKIFFVAQLVHGRDGDMGRVRRQPEAVPAVSEFRRAFERAPAVASNDNWDWDFGPRAKERVCIADVYTAKFGRVALEQFSHCRDVLIR